LRTVSVETTADSSEEVDETDGPITADMVMEQLHRDFDEAFGSTPSNSWCGTFAFLKTHLMSEHGLTLEQLKRCCIYHILDTMMIPSKLLLLATLCSDGSCAFAPKSDVELFTQEYFNKKIITSKNGTIGIIFGKDSKSTQMLLFENGKWVDAPFVERGVLLKHANYYMIDKTKLSDTIGFVAWFESTRTREYVFKSRILSDSKVNKVGARVIQAQSKDIIKNINTVLGEPKYNIKNIKTYDLETKIKLAVLFEVLVRSADDEQKDGKIWYLNNEQVLLSNLIAYGRAAEN